MHWCNIRRKPIINDLKLLPTAIPNEFQQNGKDGNASARDASERKECVSSLRDALGLRPGPPRGGVRRRLRNPCEARRNHPPGQAFCEQWNATPVLPELRARLAWSPQDHRRGRNGSLERKQSQDNELELDEKSAYPPPLATLWPHPPPSLRARSVRK